LKSFFGKKKSNYKNMKVPMIIPFSIINLLESSQLELGYLWTNLTDLGKIRNRAWTEIVNFQTYKKTKSVHFAVRQCSHQLGAGSILFLLVCIRIRALKCELCPKPRRRNPMSSCEKSKIRTAEIHDCPKLGK